MAEVYGSKSPNIQEFLESLKGKSPRQQQLMSAFKALGILPTPMAVEDEEAQMMADLAGLGGDSPITMESLVKKAPKVIEKAASTTQAPQTDADMIKEFLAKKGAAPAEAPTIQVSQPASETGDLLSNMEALLKKTGSPKAELIKPSVNPPAMSMPSGGMQMEATATSLPKAGKVAKNANNAIRELAEKAPHKMPVRAPAAEEAATRLANKTGMASVGKDAMGQEFDALRDLYQTAYKLQAPAAQKDIEDLINEMVSSGSLRAPTNEATLNYIAHRRMMIQTQLNNLIRALGQQGK